MDNTIKIAAGLLIAVALVFAIVFIVPQQVEKTPVAGTVTVYFFYGEECPHCHTVMPFVKSLQQKYPDVDFQILETWHNTTNQALSVSMNRKLGVGTAGVPEVVVGNVVLVGDKDIPAKLEDAVIGELKKTGN
jgi:thiol-disulfide isomerase/thioredoxin